MKLHFNFGDIQISFTDYIIDNGACVQLIVKDRNKCSWSHSIPRIGKALFSSLKKEGLVAQKKSDSMYWMFTKKIDTIDGVFGYSKPVLKTTKLFEVSISEESGFVISEREVLSEGLKTFKIKDSVGTTIVPKESINQLNHKYYSNYVYASSTEKIEEAKSLLLSLVDKHVGDLLDKLEEVCKLQALLQSQITGELKNDKVVYFTGELKMTSNEEHTLKDLIREAICTDGGHHKQWYLEKIAQLLKIELPDHDPGIAP